jgi:hypothetical protein
MTADFAFTEPTESVLAPTLDPHGSLIAPVVIEAAVGVLIFDAPRELQYVIGDGPTEVTANPQVAPGSFIGQELILLGSSDANMVVLHNGDGLALNGICALGRSASLYLVWNGSRWVEVLRNDE